jgi:hypothetical protein
VYAGSIPTPASNKFNDLPDHHAVSVPVFGECTFASTAETLRGHHLIASAVQVFMHTNRFNGDPSYANQATITLEPSNALGEGRHRFRH